MDKQQRPPAGGYSKRHVSGMLKFMADDEQRTKALDAAEAHRELFAGEEWAPIMAKMQQVFEEDHIKVVSRRRSAPRTPVAKPTLTTSASEPPLPLVPIEMPLLGLPRVNSSLLPLGRDRAPSIPRVRWDVISRSPATPLTPTPMGNAFAGGGFWEQLTPKTPFPVTPDTATPPSPLSPVVPNDAEARAAYDQVKADVDTMARTVCANRMSTLSRFSGNSDHIPQSLVRPRDELKGAIITLQHRQVDLRSAIDPDLPKKLSDLAEEEAKILEQYSITNMFELLDFDLWSQINEQTFEITTILDAQREMMHMHRHRRKSTLIHISDRAVQQAWATRILEDAECMVEAEGDSSSTYSDDDKGYDYNNFLRSIRRGITSGSSLTLNTNNGSLEGFPSFGSSSTNTDSLSLSRQTTLRSPRSSASPTKPNNLALRSREASFSSSPTRVNGRVIRSREASLSNSPTKTNASAARSRQVSFSNSPGSSRRPSGATNISLNSKGLSIITTHITEEDETVPVSEVSPEIKVARRRGVGHADMTNWAEDLKLMVERQKKNRIKDIYPAFRAEQHRRGNDSTESSDSWKCADATKSKIDATVDSEGLYRMSDADTVPFPGNTTVFAGSAPYSNSHAPLQSLAPAPAINIPPLPLPPPSRTQSPSISSLHDTIWQTYHTRSRSSIARGTGVEEETADEWTKELKRMESIEKIRQLREVCAEIRRGTEKAIGNAEQQELDKQILEKKQASDEAKWRKRGW
jgi:hypothetical protein